MRKNMSCFFVKELKCLSIIFGWTNTRNCVHGLKPYSSVSVIASRTHGDPFVLASFKISFFPRARNQSRASDCQSIRHQGWQNSPSSGKMDHPMSKEDRIKQLASAWNSCNQTRPLLPPDDPGVRNRKLIFSSDQELRKSNCLSICPSVCLWYCWILHSIFMQSVSSQLAVS